MSNGYGAAARRAVRSGSRSAWQSTPPSFARFPFPVPLVTLQARRSARLAPPPPPAADVPQAVEPTFRHPSQLVVVHRPDQVKGNPGLFGIGAVYPLPGSATPEGAGEVAEAQQRCGPANR